MAWDALWPVGRRKEDSAVVGHPAKSRFQRIAREDPSQAHSCVPSRRGSGDRLDTSRAKFGNLVGAPVLAERSLAVADGSRVFVRN